MGQSKEARITRRGGRVSIMPAACCVVVLDDVGYIIKLLLAREADPELEYILHFFSGVDTRGVERDLGA